MQYIYNYMSLLLRWWCMHNTVYVVQDARASQRETVGMLREALGPREGELKGAYPVGKIDMLSSPRRVAR